jgi:hypothetical protein
VQSIGNADFTVTVKFDSIPNQQYQFQGIVVEQDSANFLRFQLGSSGSALVAGADKVLSHTETGLISRSISIPNGTTSLWLRIQKSGTTWTETWSADGSSYNSVGSFNQLLTPSNIGPFAGNYSNTSAPAFTAAVDYFLAQ